MTIGINDVVSIRAKQLLGTEQCMNTFYVRNTGGNTVNDSTFIAAAQSWVHSIWNPNTGALTTDWASDTIQMYNMTADVPVGEVLWSVALSGSNATHSLPYQVSGLVTFPTNTKRSLGKKYMGGFTEAATDGGSVANASLIATLIAMGASIIAGFTAGTTSFTVGNYNIPLAAFSPYVSAIAEVLLATQRRRKPGVGA